MSRAKLNIRFPDIPAIKIKQKKSLLCAIDTSASVSNQELTAFFTQIHHILKGGIDVTIVECDVDIKRIYQYKRGKKPKVSGRGGTSFEPVIKLLNEDGRYNGLVYFTDGYGSFSSKPLKPCLWVITPRGDKNFKPFRGIVVHMNSLTGE